MSWLCERYVTERKDLNEEGNQHTLSSPAVNKYLLSTHYILAFGIQRSLPLRSLQFSEVIHEINTQIKVSLQIVTSALKKKTWVLWMT